jgi:hypothetical protein
MFKSIYYDLVWLHLYFLIYYSNLDQLIFYVVFRLIMFGYTYNDMHEPKDAPALDTLGKKT